MSETQLPEHSGGSGLDHDNALHRGVPLVYELCLSTGVAERHRRESTCCASWVILKITRALLGKIPRDISRRSLREMFFCPFACKYRSRDAIQTVPEEILICRSHPNSSRGNV